MKCAKCDVTAVAKHVWECDHHVNFHILACDCNLNQHLSVESWFIRKSSAFNRDMESLPSVNFVSILVVFILGLSMFSHFCMLFHCFSFCLFLDKGVFYSFIILGLTHCALSLSLFFYWCSQFISWLHWHFLFFPLLKWWLTFVLYITTNEDCR